MSVRFWRFLAILAVAFFMSAAVGHLMELPQKMDYDARTYVQLQHTLYWNFGVLGGFGEIVGLVTAVGLAIWSRRHRPAAFPLTALAAICLAAAHAAFWIRVQPANNAFASWDLTTIPSDWTHWRNQWEYTHAVRALLSVVALASLVAAILRETPSSETEHASMRVPIAVH